MTLVNLRAGQDSGYFFLEPTVNALVYGANAGVDVVNMSFYVDPWLYNCTANPADSPEAQQQQRTIRWPCSGPWTYARSKGVTLIAALGNENTDLGNPVIDETSPDYPPDTAYPRTIDNSCIDVPAESEGVISVSAIGPSGNKADYSQLGPRADRRLRAGRFFRDFPGTDRNRTPENLILAPVPEGPRRGQRPAGGGRHAERPVRGAGLHRGGRLRLLPVPAGHLDGRPARRGRGGAHREPLRQGDRKRGGKTLRPAVTEWYLRRSARDTACPEPRLVTYPDRDETYNAVCEGTPERNGFYGDGIVDAAAAVGAKH